MARRRVKRPKRARTYRRKKVCKKVCTVCGNAYPKGKMTPKKYTTHVVKFHTSSVYC